MGMFFYRSELVAELGAAAAIVHGVLDAKDLGEGIVISHEDIAELSGLKLVTAKRALTALAGANVVYIDYYEGTDPPYVYTLAV